MPMSLVICRTFVTIKPHVPMIKFRVGNKGETGRIQPSTDSARAAASSGSKSKVISAPPIADYQLPSKYKRQPIDDKEIAAINSGGSAEFRSA